MNFNRCFLVCSGIIAIFSGINYTLGPMINSLKYPSYKKEFYWELLNCKKLSDDIEEYEKKNIPIIDPDEYDKSLYELRHCRLKSATYGMEHVSFIFNAIIGFICFVVGIFNYQDKSIPKSNIIGIISGILGLLLTLVYIIIGGILYTQYYPYTSVYKRDSDGSVAENEGGKGFKCYYYSSKGDKTSFYARYIDYMKSQYTYNKELVDFFKDTNCGISKSFYLSQCSESAYITVSEQQASCRKLYIYDSLYGSDNTQAYDMSAKFFTVLFFSILMVPCYIALIFFAFGLSKGSSDYKSM